MTERRHPDKVVGLMVQGQQIQSASTSRVNPAVAAAAGWAFPGLGYWLIGERTRGVVAGLTILFLFLSGILIAGIRSIEVPGWDDSGKKVMVGGEWILTQKPVAEILNRPWYIPQVMVGPLTLLCSKWSVDLSAPGADGQPAAPKSHARIADIGTLYSAIAGMLNLLVIIDAAHRASRKARTA